MMCLYKIKENKICKKTYQAPESPGVPSLRYWLPQAWCRCRSYVCTPSWCDARQITSWSGQRCPGARCGWYILLSQWRQPGTSIQGTQVYQQNWLYEISNIFDKIISWYIKDLDVIGTGWIFAPPQDFETFFVIVLILLRLEMEYSGLCGQYHACWCYLSCQCINLYGIDCIGQATCRVPPL